MPIMMSKGDTLVRVSPTHIRATRTSMLDRKQRTRDLPITQAEWDAYQGGDLIQRAMPRLSGPDREFLMTGYTQNDWETIFPPQEKEGE